MSTLKLTIVDTYKAKHDGHFKRVYGPRVGEWAHRFFEYERRHGCGGGACRRRKSDVKGVCNLKIVSTTSNDFRCEGVTSAFPQGRRGGRGRGHVMNCHRQDQRRVTSKQTQGGTANVEHAVCRLALAPKRNPGWNVEHAVTPRSCSMFHVPPWMQLRWGKPEAPSYTTAARTLYTYLRLLLATLTDVSCRLFDAAVEFSR